MLQAIIYDLDGVLIDSEPLMRYAFDLSYRRVIGNGTPPIEAYLEHMGEAFPQIMDQLGLPHTLWQPYREISKHNLDRIVVFPQGRDLLAWGTTRHIKQAILTGKDRARTVQLLEHFDLLRYFDVVIASDQLRNPKPDPEGMHVALRALNCSVDGAVMVGDSVSDILCAQRAGVLAIGVTWGIKPERVRRLCQPDHLVHTWEELADLLLHLWQTVPFNTSVEQEPEQYVE